MRPARVALGVLLIATICYLLPWVSGPGVALTLGGYDLAEWASLHPAARAAGLTTPLLLRLPPVLIIVMLGLLAGRARFSAPWWAALFVVGAGSIALLPPLEFFTIFRDDPNYGQQWTLALLALVGGMFALSGLAHRMCWPLVAMLALAGCLVGIQGLSGAHELMRGLGLPAEVGPGALGMLAAFAGLGGLALWRARRPRQGTRRVISPSAAK